jgi:GMP synthase-like glutamine amidotransferase
MLAFPMTANSKLRALIVQHEQPTPAGLIREWLDDREAEIDVLRIDEEIRRPDPRDYQLVVSLGSDLSAHDASVPFIRRETQLMLAAAKADVPVLGVCFGSQLLARVMGGTSLRAARSEIGWLSVRTSAPELVPAGPWFEWHHDTFTLPPAATLIAETDVGPQAFVIGRSLGLQFHLEVTPDIVETWVRGARRELAAEGVDPGALLAETRRRAPESRRITERLLNRYLDGIALSSSTVERK